MRRRPSSLGCSIARRRGHGTRLVRTRPKLKVLSSPSEGPTVGELDLLAGDEFEQHGAAVGVQLASALQRGDDFRRLLDALGVAAHGLAEISIIAADVA